MPAAGKPHERPTPHRRSAPGAREPARVTATLFAQAVPLALMLFFVFPRGLLDLSAALGRSRFGETGIDNTLDPGGIASLALRTDVAFRVRFPDGPPPPSESAGPAPAPRAAAAAPIRYRRRNQ